MTELKKNQSEIVDTNDLIQQRKEKLDEWRKLGHPFPTHFRRNVFAADLHELYNSLTTEELEQKHVLVKVAGRMMTRRLMGKASFTHIQDVSGRIQLYVKEEDVSKAQYEIFKHWDLGDIVGVEGYLFKTKTGELSIKVKQIELLTKSIRPLPDKYHGLTDVEARYRQRYLDLLVNEETKDIFVIRSKTIHAMREFMLEHQYLEVETPMMQVLAGGAAAKPFVTHHHALNMPLFLRIAPELFLKRLVVGGFERVFEINRNFRNEGLSTQHNPEFTMIEFYQAYSDYHDLMIFTEEMFRYICQRVLGTLQINYQGIDIDFSKPFETMTLKNAILKYNPTIEANDLDDLIKAKIAAKALGLSIDDQSGLGKIQVEMFEKKVESHLLQPTFITEYPAEVSPLARKNNDNPFVTDRFELFIAGREIANGFSELNDPEDQADRFKEQMAHKAKGDEEAMPYDEDYIIALEHGMPPTAGEGIGIDRLVMLLTNSASIREVILFPHMKPKD